MGCFLSTIWLVVSLNRRMGRFEEALPSYLGSLITKPLFPGCRGSLKWEKCVFTFERIGVENLISSLLSRA
ncbi:hypothetical protein CPB83DRAFT_852586 [Crepidotus variabilis]|uniref:Uncharacterized protein n=1 Tax=Crepidotus variabilis TaxID=179855 RepID=A0A9P6EGX2_9AGAR|nr:hypothetical protein CPB83DRAFT_852586 [Crepidotus variabilis]